LKSGLKFSKLFAEPVMMFVTLALGLAESWSGRYAMNPDGISYLDVGDCFFRRDWSHAFNAWWSPLYPWTLGLFVGIAKPSPRWALPLVQVVNYLFFVFALLAFRFFLDALLAWNRRRAVENQGEGLEEQLLIPLAYAIFLWVSLEVVTIYNVSPDLLVLGVYCLQMGVLLRLSLNPRPKGFALLGLLLGLGYWAKAILFPLGIAAIGASYLWKRSSEWRRGVTIAAVVFGCVSAPLILMLSHQKGRFTFGDSGKYNYAWYVSPRSFWRNWQGDTPDSGKPVHSTRRLLTDPPLYEFDGPVVGTYPPWTDPSYWNEGLEWHFQLKPQLEVLLGTIPSELRVLFRARPELVTGVAVLALLSGGGWLLTVIELWPPVLLSVLGMALYLPLVVNDRYLGGYVLVLFLVALTSVRLSSPFHRAASYVVPVVFAVMILGTADYTIRILTHHLAVPGVGPTRNTTDIVVAEKLDEAGISSGEKVAIIGEGTGAYWARLGKLRIVAEIMDAFGGSGQFWNGSGELQERVYQAFASTGAKAIVARCPVRPTPARAGWEPIAATPYCMYRFKPLSGRQASTEGTVPAEVSPKN
jgi:hypothetical protein